MPLARLDASGDRTDQGGLGTQDDQAPPTIKTEAARAGQTGATGPNHSKPAANDAESLYWASLNQQAEQKAQALAIEGWGTGTDGPAKVSANAKIAEVYYFHTDQVGLPEELSNAQGQLVWQATYKTWGNTRAEEWKLVEADGGRVHSLDEGDQPENEARQQNLRFQGQYLDRDTGLHYNTFRFYDPDIGRFISPDPIGVFGGINLQSYGPNPFGWIDPWGLSCHGNSKSSTKAQHGYEIVDTHAPGSPVVKTGVSQSPLKVDPGTGAVSSPRANSQVNKWNKEPGNAGRYEARVVKQESAGTGARERILQWEEANANKHRGTLDPNRHKRP